MFSEDLQKLINASLTDGVLTDKEREVIRKRALLEGIDPDEVDILLDSELQKLRQKAQDAVAKVKKCPRCGSVISGMEVQCPDCGYKFSEGANSSTVKLAELVNNTDSVKKKVQFIQTFPIPVAEEDLLEFLITMGTNSKSIQSDDNVENTMLRSAYQTKYSECVTKAKILYSNNEKFISALAAMDKIKEKKVSKIVLVYRAIKASEGLQTLCGIIGFILLVIFLAIFIMILDD